MNAVEKFENEIKTLIVTELKNINLLREELDKYLEKNTPVYRRAKGSILHDFYNACERIFKIIIRIIDGDKGDIVKRHKAMLNQMTIEIKGTRPVVITKKLAAELLEYLNFRHLFRNIYGFELEGDRLDRLVEKFLRVSTQFQQEINNFLNKL